MSESPVIELSHVGIRFGPTVVHRDISFKVTAGETVTVMGPSGTGKTLILKSIIGLLAPTSGEVMVLGQSLRDKPEYELRKLRMQVGMLFQGAALFDSLSIYENIAYGLRETGTEDEDFIAEKVRSLLEMINLPGIEQKFPPQLSGGQKKRVGLARALATSPRIMLLDEPTTGLDPTSKRLIDDLIVCMNEKFGMTTIAVTHDIESATRISERWILLHDGQVVADGPARELAAHNQEAIDFIRGNWKDE
ncbi:MAG: ATP-binding cassette domain-containing protein [Deltaproteobacteria bacterium]|nr:ATP-binding cassette domain-containing protein [Deltaproteobacteria bacterium]